MPIVSSSYVIDAHEQRDGSRYVIEHHTDDAGRVYSVGPYLADESVDVQARVTARAAGINAQLAEAEADDVMGAD